MKNNKYNRERGSLRYDVGGPTPLPLANQPATTSGLKTNTKNTKDKHPTPSAGSLALGSGLNSNVNRRMA